MAGDYARIPDKTMDEAQKYVIEQSKQKTAAILDKMQIPINILLLFAMGIFCWYYASHGNIAFAIVFGIFAFVQIYSLATKIITRKKPQQTQQETPASTVSAPYIQ